jgi:hypothetical protein
LGYTEGNLRWILRGINMLKDTGSDADVVAIARAIVASEGL